MILERCKTARYLLASCLLLSPFSSPGATDGGPGENPDLNRLKNEWAQTLDALQDYSAAQREAALARVEALLNAMDTRIEQLQARLDKQRATLAASALQAREQSLHALRKQRNEVAEWYGAMKHSSTAAWDSVKQGFIDSYGVLSDAFVQAWNEFGNHEDNAAP